MPLRTYSKYLAIQANKNMASLVTAFPNNVQMPWKLQTFADQVVLIGSVHMYLCHQGKAEALCF